MKLFRLALALCAFSPLSTLVSVQPAMAQANCRWNLDGEWVGQRTGNRTMIEMRPGGFFSWIPGQPKPGQSDANNTFREAGPKTWILTFPDGQKTTVRLEPSNMLRITNPDGWTDLFKRVRPAGPPQCVGGNSTAAAAAPAQPGGTARPLAGPAGNRASGSTTSGPVRGIDLATLRAIVSSEGYSVTEAQVSEGGPQVKGVTSSGSSVMAMAGKCTMPAGTNCNDVSFILIFQNVTDQGFEKATRISQETTLAGVYYPEAQVLVAGRYVPIYSGVTTQYIRENLRSLREQEPAVRAIVER